jgi:hypothetical protein
VRSSWVFLKFQLLTCFLLGASVTFAGSNANLVYSGRILRPDGSVINTGAMTFTLAIKDASNNCTLWKETHTISMADSLGTFALTVGAGTRTDGGTHTFKQTLINAGTLTGLTCASGTTYSPGSSDDRNLAVSFDDAGTVVNLAAVAIKSVPFAMQADQVSGYGIMNLAKISGLGTATSITGTQFDFLANLAAPASATATPCANNDTLKFVGGVWTCAAAGGSGAASTSTLTSATGTNSTDNTNFTQTWNWSTLSNQTGLSLTSSSNALVAGGTILNVANTGTSTDGTVARIQSNPTAGSGLTVLANGNVGIGTASPDRPLSVVGGIRQQGGTGSSGLLLGATSGSNILTDATLKQARIGSTPYNNSSSPSAMLYSQNSSTENQLNVGGGTTAYNAATSILFHTAINNTTLTGTERMRIAESGNVGIGTTGPTAKLHISGGAIVGSAQSISTQCVDFSTGNIQVSSYVATNSVRIGGLVDGGAYTLVLTGYTAGQTITFTGFTDAGCTVGVTHGVDFGGSSGAVTPTLVAVGNTQLVTFIYSSARGVVYASAGTNFYR